MNKSTKTIEFKFERTIPAPPEQVFDAWLDAEFPGNPWNMADKVLLNPQVDGFFCWNINETSHYGRFTEVARPGHIRHTWVSPNTLGQESMVTLTFKKQGEGTLMSLLHFKLPDDDLARSHEKGWNFILDTFVSHFKNGSRRK